MQEKLLDSSLIDVGSRELSNDEINHLKYITSTIFDSILTFETQYQACQKIAEMMLAADINFKYAYTAFEAIHSHPKTFKILEKVYSSPIPSENIYKLYEILYSDVMGLDKKSAKQITREIIETIQKDPYEDMIVASTSSDTQYINNTLKKQVIFQKIKIIRNKDYSSEYTVLNASIKELTVYDNPLDDDPRQFKVVLEIPSSKNELTLGPWLLEDISSFLSESGYVMNQNLMKDCLPTLFNTFIFKKKAKIKNEIEYPGFYYKKEEDKILNIKYEIDDVSKEELNGSLEFLETFAEQFIEQKDKLAHILKWGLIAPFSFAMKQRGRWINHLYLFGKAGSGKTTLADMVLYLWSTPDSDNNDIGGSSFNTEARIGEKLKQSTFPVVVNEPKSALENPSVVEMIKTAIERTNSRGKFVGKRYKNILALSPVIYTSNHVLPSDDALIRRMDCISFSYSERKSVEEKEEFINLFNIENRRDCLLNRLKPLAHYFAKEIIDKPSELDHDWRELTNLLLTRAYMDVDREMPEWLLKWSKTESLEDLDDIMIGRMRAFLRNEINQAFGRIERIDEDGRRIKDKFDYRAEAKTTMHFYNRVWSVIDEGKIPYLYLTGQNNVYITREFLDQLEKHVNITDSLKSISELLNWKYVIRKIGNSRKSAKVIQTDFHTFLEFVFPSYEDE